MFNRIKAHINCCLYGHVWVFVRNIYGDESYICGGYRSMWRCTKCNKFHWSRKLGSEGK